MNRLAIYRGMVVREGTIDDNIVRQVWDDYGLLDFENKIVIDGGAHIGAFTEMAIKRGANQVIAFEPERENIILFRINLLGQIMNSNVIFSESALIADAGGSNEDKKLNAYYGENRGMHSLKKGAMEARGIYSYSVLEVYLSNLYTCLKKYKPDIIKLDIEGSETELLPMLSSDTNSATQMAIEFHVFNNNMRQANINFVSVLPDLGWKVVKPPMVHEGHQSTVGIFKR